MSEVSDENASDALMKEVTLMKMTQTTFGDASETWSWRFDRFDLGYGSSSSSSG